MKYKNYEKPTGVQVFLEFKSRRLFVGLLKKLDHLFYFEYDQKYLRARSAIPLGPEMPLTRRTFQSETLFVPFLDRIPSRENPAYTEYCEATGVLKSETDPFLLLTTIARRGPSSFIFEPWYEDAFTGKDLLAFRKSLKISVKEFAACFEFSTAAITRIELNKSSGRDVLKRVEIYARHPDVALEQIRKHGGILHSDKQKTVELILTALVSNCERTLC
jgi:HipA-like protein